MFGHVRDGVTQKTFFDVKSEPPEWTLCAFRPVNDKNCRFQLPVQQTMYLFFTFFAERNYVESCLKNKLTVYLFACFVRIFFFFFMQHTKHRISIDLWPAHRENMAASRGRTNKLKIDIVLKRHLSESVYLWIFIHLIRNALKS